MSTFMKRERDSHWYHPNGESCHEVPYADPNKGYRATTLRDARKLGLLPSVTNILSIKSKQGLEIWKQEQAILSAITLPRKPGETDDDFARRVVEDSEQEAKKAAEFGTAIHDQIESYNREGVFSGTGEILQYVEPYEVWFREHVETVLLAENTVIGEIGYAGRLDLFAELKDGRKAIIDIKTQKFKGKGKPNFYKEWAMQLAAYADPVRVADGPMPVLMSLVIPSDEIPSQVYPYEWDDPLGALDCFHACHRLWCWDKGYTPDAR